MEMPSTLHLIAEPRRREILRLVWDRELSAGEIASRFDVTFGAVSQHLRLLRDAGLVSRRKQGRRRLYRARPDALGPLVPVLEAFWRDRLDTLKHLAQSEEATP